MRGRQGALAAGANARVGGRVGLLQRSANLLPTPHTPPRARSHSPRALPHLPQPLLFCNWLRGGRGYCVFATANARARVLAARREGTHAARDAKARELLVAAVVWQVASEGAHAHGHVPTFTSSRPPPISARAITRRRCAGVCGWCCCATAAAGSGCCCCCSGRALLRAVLAACARDTRSGVACC